MRVICQVVNSAVLFESKSEISKIGRGLWCMPDSAKMIMSRVF